MPRGLPEVLPPVTLGGGGTTFAFSELPLPPLALPDVTDGGGGTTSVVPNIFPSKLLTIDPVPACVGGGGTTVLAGAGMLPLASPGRAGESWAKGGGAMTEGVGNVNSGWGV